MKIYMYLLKIFPNVLNTLRFWIHSKVKISHTKAVKKILTAAMSGRNINSKSKKIA